MAKYILKICIRTKFIENNNNNISNNNNNTK